MAEAREFLKKYCLEHLEYGIWERRKRKVVESLVEYTDRLIRELEEGEVLVLELESRTLYLHSDGTVASKKKEKKKKMRIEEFINEYCITPEDVGRYLKALDNARKLGGV